MTRNDLFDAIRPFAPDKRFSQPEVAAIDDLADSLGLPRAVPMPLASAEPAVAPKGTLVTLIGATAAAALLGALTTLEGKRNVGYLDIVGIPTKCMGDTTNVIVGKFYSDAECQASLEKQAVAHAGEVLKCTPGLRGRDNQLIAAGLLAYNIGGASYCKSTVDRQFDGGNWRAGCEAFALWNRAGGKVVPGLVNRRAFETKICMKGL